MKSLDKYSPTKNILWRKVSKTNHVRWLRKVGSMVWNDGSCWSHIHCSQEEPLKESMESRVCTECDHVWPISELSMWADRLYRYTRFVEDSSPPPVDLPSWKRLFFWREKMPLWYKVTLLIGGFEQFLFFHILGFSSSQLIHIFSEGLKPPTSI